MLFCSYWLPELLSAFDAVDHGRAFRESLVYLRYLPFLWLVAAAVGNPRGRRITFAGIGIIVAAWTLDALVQAVAGTSLLFAGMDAIKRLGGGHGMCTAAQAQLADRLSGVLVKAPLTVTIGGVCCIGAAVVFAHTLPALRTLVKPIYQKRGLMPEDEVIAELEEAR